MERSLFNMSRNATFSSDELKYFERCKEERLSRDKGGEYFESIVSSSCPLSCDQLSNKPFFLGFLGYIVACQIRSIVETSNRSRNEGHLRQLEHPLTLEEIT